MSREFLMATTCHHGFTLSTRDQKILAPRQSHVQPCSSTHSELLHEDSVAKSRRQ